MQEYRFGGSVIKRVVGKSISGAAWIACSFSRLFMRLAKWVNTRVVRLRVRAEHLKRDSEPITIHITRIIPLDRWTLRIEFTADRKTRHCMHVDSPEGGFTEVFSRFKRGDELEITDNYYYVLSDTINSWKKM